MQQNLARRIVTPANRQETLQFAKKIVGEASRFVGFGFVSYGLGVGLTAFFREVLGLHEEVSVAFTLVILFLVNFWLVRRFVFRSFGNELKQFLRFVSMSAAMRGAEYVMFLGLLRVMHAHYLLALTVAMVVSACAKFLLYRTVVFS
jgi:putative flippase GtrA